MKIKTYRLLILLVGISISIGIISSTFLKVTERKHLVSLSESVINMLYKYNDIDTLVTNATNLEPLCEPRVFAILDNRSKANVTRRFNTYTTTVPSIKSISVNGRDAYAIVAFNAESNLRDRYIVISYNEAGKVKDYKEYEFVDRFAEKTDFVGDFESSRNSDYLMGEGEDSVVDMDTYTHSHPEEIGEE